MSANGYTVSIGEAIASFLAIPSLQTATATINSNSIDFSKVRRGAFRFTTGTFGGTSPTLSAALTLQVSADNSTWTALNTANNNNTTATVTTAQTEQMLEVRGDQLAQQSAIDGTAYRYARLQAACTIGGTSPTIPISLDAIAKDVMQGPAYQANATGVNTPLQVVSL